MNETRSLERLLRPRSIAVFGGSWASNVVTQCQHMEYDGDVWPVHPTRDSINGIPCYRSVADLPGAPDASFVGVNRDATLDVVEQLAQRESGGAVCFASGFSEVERLTGDGHAKQSQLVTSAGHMPVLGPNCYGFINYLDGVLLWPDQHGGVRLNAINHADGSETGVAIVMQSSNMAINVTMQQRGLPLGYVICAGNQAQTDTAAIVDTLLDDDRISVVGLHIEGIKDIAAFEAMAGKARERGKPLVALTVGRSQAAQHATLSHTASVAGDAKAGGAFFFQLGIPVCESLPVFLETLKLLHVHGPLSGRRLSSMSCSGGEASLIADAATRYRVEFPVLRALHQNRIAATLNELVVVANPLDYHTFIWGDEDAMANTFAAMVSGDFDLNLLVLDFPRADRCSDADWHAVVEAISGVSRRSEHKVAVVASLPENLPEAWCKAFMLCGIAPLHGFDEALAAIGAAADLGDMMSNPAPVHWPQLANRSAQTRLEGELIDEYTAKRRLNESVGVDVPLGFVVTNPQEVLSALPQLKFPLVAKSLGLAHKTDANAVALGLNSVDAVIAATSRLFTLSSTILLEEMVTDAVAEVLVGVHYDPVYGPMLTVGAGGVMVEILNDTFTCRMPVGTDDVLRQLQSLRLFALLTGYRGFPQADLQALVDAIMALQHFAQQHHGQLIELDINPLLVRPKERHSGAGAIAVDALINISKDL